MATLPELGLTTDDLTAQLDAAQAVVDPSPADVESGEVQNDLWCNLSVRVWLPGKDSKLFKSVRHDQTKAGKLRVKLAAGPTAYSDQAGKYLSGELMTFVFTNNGYGDLATDALRRMLNDQGRLVDIAARLNVYQLDPNSKVTRSDWFVVSMTEVATNLPADDADPQTTVVAEFQQILDDVEAAESAE